MINIMYLVLTAILALNVSAEILEAFKTVDKSLINSSASIKASNDVLYKSLQDKLTDPNTNKVLAQQWHDNADKVKKLSDDMDTYLNDLKQQLKKGANLVMKEKDGKQVEDFKEDNLDASTRLFETNKKGEELEKRLADYKAQVLGIDSAIGREFLNSFPVTVEVPKGQEGKVKSFTTTYFHMTPTVAALTILSKFQNNIKTAENQVVTFCHNKIGQVVVHMDQVGVLVGQSSNYLMPGQELVVTAGVGAYSSSANASISINGSSVAVDKGQGTYKTTVSGSGEHSIPINVTFVGEDGKPVTVPSTVKYVVGVPGGAAVMLDKMNVFYIGVPNPITISSGTGWDKTTVSMTGGTISGTGSNRVVTVSAIGAASITVSADGKSNKFDFRVKRIPDPIIKVGPSGGGRMQAAIFRVQQYVSAVLENFDFDAHFSVTGATIYFNNPGDRNVKQVSISSGSLAPAKAYMDALVPGSTVTFDNIRVVGPDGQTRTIQNPPGFSLF
jgi:gliding motility-associated protein GldM